MNGAARQLSMLPEPEPRPTVAVPLTCPRCGRKTDAPLLTVAGPHTRADCRECRSFVKFVPKAEVLP